MSPDGQWSFAEDVPEDLRACLSSGRWRQEAACVKRNRRRAVYRYLPAEGKPPVFLKEDVANGPLDRAKDLFRRKAAQEYSALADARRAGLAVAAPLGWAATDCGGILATAGVPGHSFRDVWRSTDAGDRPHPDELLGATARFLGHVLRQGLDHPDLHAGNIMVSWEAGRLHLALLDLYGARVVQAMGVERKRRMLFWLVPVLEELPVARRQRVLDEVAAGNDPSLASWPALVRAWSRFRAARWRGWQRRILGESSICCRLALEGARGVALRPSTAAIQALAAYRQGAAGLENLKEDRKRRVARVRVDGCPSLIVKEYLRVGWRWLWRPDRRGWLNTARLRQLTLRAASCQAWLRTDAGNGCLVQEDAGELCLHDHIPCGCPTAAERRPWVEQVADGLAFLHLCGCFHADLKVANWVAGSSGRVRIVDCDDVRFYRTIPEWARLRNLRQLAETCPPALSRRERLRFLALYGRISELARSRIRELARQLPG